MNNTSLRSSVLFTALEMSVLRTINQAQPSSSARKDTYPESSTRNSAAGHDLSLPRKGTSCFTGRTKLRRVVFTLNNYTTSQYEKLKKLPDVTAIILGKEVGESGTPHLQGAILFSKQKTFPTLQKLLFKAHIERMKGTPLQAFEYCRKEGDFYEYGELPKPGKRNDLKKTIEKFTMVRTYATSLRTLNMLVSLYVITRA